MPPGASAPGSGSPCSAGRGKLPDLRVAGVAGGAARAGLLAAVHFAAPGAGLAAALLERLLELLHRALDVRRDDAHGVGGLLDERLRLVLHRELHARAVVRDLLEPCD